MLVEVYADLASEVIAQIRTVMEDFVVTRQYKTWLTERFPLPEDPEPEEDPGRSARDPASWSGSRPGASSCPISARPQRAAGGQPECGTAGGRRGARGRASGTCPRTSGPGPGRRRATRGATRFLVDTKYIGLSFGEEPEPRRRS